LSCLVQRRGTPHEEAAERTADHDTHTADHGLVVVVVVVVVESPGFDEERRIGQANKPMSIQTFMPKPTVEALDKRLLDRLAGVDER
jgi:hypothetical protein